MLRAVTIVIEWSPAGGRVTGNLEEERYETRGSPSDVGAIDTGVRTQQRLAVAAATPAAATPAAGRISPAAAISRVGLIFPVVVRTSPAPRTSAAAPGRTTPRPPLPITTATGGARQVATSTHWTAPAAAWPYGRNTAVGAARPDGMGARMVPATVTSDTGAAATGADASGQALITVPDSPGSCRRYRCTAPRSGGTASPITTTTTSTTRGTRRPTATSPPIRRRSRRARAPQPDAAPDGAAAQCRRQRRRPPRRNRFRPVSSRLPPPARRPPGRQRSCVRLSDQRTERGAAGCGPLAVRSVGRIAGRVSRSQTIGAP